MTLQVVLVEDQDVIRTCTAEMLEDAGMPTQEAASAEQALPLLAALRGRAVLVTDLNFPAGMSGLELIALVHRDWPWIGTVLASGADAQGLVLPQGVRFLAKPFAFRHLVQAIASAAAAGSRHGNALELDGQAN